MTVEFDKLLYRISRKLDEAGIAHMLTGSFALAHYVHEFRGTNDMDLVLDAHEEHVGALLAMFPQEDGWYVSEAAMRDALTRRSMFNAIHTSSGIKLDLIQKKADELENLKLKRRKRVARGDKGFWIISPEDLLLSKLAWGMPSDSAVQMRDIRTLLRDHPDLDWDYVNGWADSIGVRSWLDRARAQ